MMILRLVHEPTLLIFIMMEHYTFLYQMEAVIMISTITILLSRLISGTIMLLLVMLEIHRQQHLNFLLMDRVLEMVLLILLIIFQLSLILQQSLLLVADKI